MADEKLQIVIAATDQASPALKGVATSVKGVGEAAKQADQVTGTAFGRMSGYVEQHRTTLLVGAAAVTAFGASVMAMAKECVGAYAEAEAANTKLALSIKNAGQGVNQSNLVKLADDLMLVTTYDDEATKGMMSFLAAAKLNEGQIKQLTPAMLDLAEFMGKDLEGSAKMLAYTLETGNVAGLKRLKVAVDETKFALDPVGALVDAITAKCGGMAKAAGQDLGGQLKILGNVVEDDKEKLGAALAPALLQVTHALIPLVKAVGDFAEKHPLVTQMAVAVGGVATAIGGIAFIGIGAILALAKIKKEFAELGIAASLSAKAVTTAATQIAVATEAAAVGTSIGGVGVGAGVARGARKGVTLTGSAAQMAEGYVGGNVVSRGARGLWGRLTGRGVAAAAEGEGAALGVAEGITARGVIGGAARVAGRYVLPAYIAYEGLNYLWSSQAAASEQQVADIESGEAYTPEEKALLSRNSERWAKSRSARAELYGMGRGNIPSLAGMTDEQRAAFLAMTPEEQRNLGRPALGEIATPLAEQPEVGSLEPALWGGKGTPISLARPRPAPSVIGSGRDVRVSESRNAAGEREILIRVQIADGVSPGLLADGVTDWMNELQYAQVGF